MVDQPSTPGSDRGGSGRRRFRRLTHVAVGFTSFAPSRRIREWLKVERDFRQAMYGDEDDGPQQTITVRH